MHTTIICNIGELDIHSFFNHLHDFLLHYYVPLPWNMCSLSKGQSILLRETIQNAFFQNYAPFSTQILQNVKVFLCYYLKDIPLKLGVCVHYPKSNPYYQGIQFKLYTLYQAPHSQALAPVCCALVHLHFQFGQV